MFLVLCNLLEVSVLCLGVRRAPHTSSAHHYIVINLCSVYLFILLCQCSMPKSRDSGTNSTEAIVSLYRIKSSDFWNNFAFNLYFSRARSLICSFCSENYILTQFVNSSNRILKRKRYRRWRR